MLGSTTFFICAIITHIYIPASNGDLLNEWKQLCSAPITYTVNTGNPKAETTFGVEACNIIWVSEVDLWEVLLLGSNFTFQYAISFGNTEMKFIANIDSKKHIYQLHSLHLLACKTYSLTGFTFIPRTSTQPAGYSTWI